MFVLMIQVSERIIDFFYAMFFFFYSGLFFDQVLRTLL